ncbi:hypothetical protein IWW49_002429, partial [Coemansia sp. RSA 1797]
VEGSVGLLCPNVCARVVLNGTELGDGQYGEILVSTPRMTAATAASNETASDLSSYFYTGDFGTVTSDGVVIVKARMTELLHVRGGQVVAPSDIEEQLLHLPQVADCAVVAMRRCVDDITFDVPVVFIVPTDKGSPERAALQKLVNPF